MAINISFKRGFQISISIAASQNVRNCGIALLINFNKALPFMFVAVVNGDKANGEPGVLAYLTVSLFTGFGGCKRGLQIRYEDNGKEA